MARGRNKTNITILKVLTVSVCEAHGVQLVCVC